MPVGLLTLEIYIPDAHSLKDKRQVIRSLKDRLRSRFNVAVAELDYRMPASALRLASSAFPITPYISSNRWRLFLWKRKICSAATWSITISKC